MENWKKDARKEVVMTDLEALVPKDHLWRRLIFKFKKLQRRTFVAAAISIKVSTLQPDTPVSIRWIKVRLMPSSPHNSASCYCVERDNEIFDFLADILYPWGWKNRCLD